MKKFRIESTLLNRDAVISTLWSTLQQIVVAASTYFILEAIRSVTSGDMRRGIIFISAFVASLILVYVPNTLSMAYLQRWRLSSIDSFVKAFTQFNFGKTLRGHARNKADSEAWLTNESFTVYDQATNLLYQAYSTLLNSTLNILVIAVALDSRILFWYLLAAGLLMLSNFLFGGRISSVAGEMQNSRKQLSDVMLSSWDNIFVGNRHNLANWQLNYETLMSAARAKATRYDLVRSLISSATVSLALVLVAVGNGIFLYENSQSLPKVAALFITLPRQLQIIQSIFAFFNLTLSWTGVRAQLNELQKIVLFGELQENSLNYVQFGSIEIFNQKSKKELADFTEMKTFIAGEKNGRFTIRGKNGAGKSTLLGLIKEELGTQAFFLPTHYADLKFQSAFLSQSDGRRLLSVFEHIAALREVDYVILDEWDANLDQENVMKVSLAIDKLAETKFVIESRHRVS